VDDFQNVPDRPEIVTAILLSGDGRVLLCHRSALRQRFPNVWALPGGHIEPGETATQALVRELREELNIGIDEPSSAPRAVIEAAEFRMQIWLINVWDGAVSNAAPDEHDEVTWADLTAISDLELAHGGHRALLADVLSVSGPAT
jgi:mutator protein MutT